MRQWCNMIRCLRGKNAKRFEEYDIPLQRHVEFLRLCGIDHAQRHTRFHAHRSHAANHLLDILQVRLAPTHVSPCCPHAEAAAPVLFGSLGCFENGFYSDHLRGLETGVVPTALGAVTAVLAAAARLDIHKRTHLDGLWRVKASMER